MAYQNFAKRFSIKLSWQGTRVPIVEIWEGNAMGIIKIPGLFLLVQSWQ